MPPPVVLLRRPAVDYTRTVREGIDPQVVAAQIGVVHVPHVQHPALVDRAVHKAEVHRRLLPVHRSHLRRRNGLALEDRAVLLDARRKRRSADALRHPDDLRLVEPDKRTQDRQGRNSLDRPQIAQRLGRHLAQRLTGDDRVRPDLRGHPLSRPVHQPLEHDLPVAGGDALLELADRLAEVHHMYPRAVSVAPAIRQHFGDLDHRTLEGGARQIAEDVVQGDSPLEQQPRRDRRVEATRNQADRSPLHSQRQTAGTLRSAAVEVGMLVAHFDRHGDLGRRQVDGSIRVQRRAQLNADVS